MEAKVKLILDGKEFHAKMILAAEDLQKVRAESEAVGHKVANWGMAVTGFNQALQVLSSQIVPIISKPFQEAGQIEQYRTSLKVMLGDADLAQKRLDELIKFAAETPFELPQVVEAGNKLQALGRYSQETLRDLGDLSSAAGKPFEQTLSAYAKLASGQKGIAIDMFRDLLITTEDWSKATGKAFAKSGEFLGTYEEMLEALPKIIKDKDFSGMMEQQSKTLFGKLSNLKDMVGQTMSETGEQFLPFAKSLIDTAIPAIQLLKENVQTVGPVVGGLTLATILYTTSVKAQTIAENISLASLKNGIIARSLKAVQTRLMASAETLATASTLAYGVATDVVTGKITVQTGAMQILKLTAMSLGAVMTLAGASLAGITLAWGLYEMTVGKARDRMVDATKETERLKLGMNDLQKTLDSMSFKNIQDEIEETNKKIAEAEKGVKSLQALTALKPTGVPFIDAILTKGNSDWVYDMIEAQKGQIDVFKDYNKELETYKKKIEDAEKFTDSYNKSTLKSLMTINQVRDARSKVSLVQGRAETDEERKRIASIIEDLDKLESKYKAGKDSEKDKSKKTYEQIVSDKISYFEELNKIDKASTVNFKKYLDEQLHYYTVTLKNEKNGFENFTSEQLKGFNEVKEKLKEVNSDLAKPITLKDIPEPKGLDFGKGNFKPIVFDPEGKAKFAAEQKEIAQLRVEAIADSNQRAMAEIENWYVEKQELQLYKDNADAKTLIDQQYYNRKRELFQQQAIDEMESIRNVYSLQRNIVYEIADLEKSGAEKRQAILSSLYSWGVDLLLKYLEEFILRKSVELATHTATESAKTAVTLAQAGIRSGAESGSGAASAAGGSGGGGGGLFSTIFSVVGSLFGFLGLAKGGAIIGENGPELVAPIETYVDANRNLVTKTVLAVERSLADVQLKSLKMGSGSVQIESLLKSNLDAIQKWQKQLQFGIKAGDLKTAVDNANSYYSKFEVR